MIPVHDLERSVIGAVLLRADNLALLPSLESTHFFAPFARATWDAIRRLESRNQPIDITTIADELHKRRVFKEQGQTPAESDAGDSSIWAYLSDCAVQVPTVDNAIEYARRIKDHSLRRRLGEMFGELTSEYQRAEITGAELLSMALAGLSVLDAEAPDDASPIGEVIKRRVAQLDQIMRDKEHGLSSLTGAHTGVASLDDKLGGWQYGIVTIIAARPGMGKSSLGLATADACTQKGSGVHLFSLEDTEAAYADRVLARTTGVTTESLRNCKLTAIELQATKTAIADLVKRPGWLFDGRSGITAAEIVRSVRRHKRANGTRVAIVDYVQLVSKPHPRMTAHEALSEIVTTFADAAKQDGIAYIVMSQLNREIEKREDKRPQLSDLRESGSLEERAKCVVGIYRGAAYGDKPKKGIDYQADQSPPNAYEFERQAQLLVLKNSNGRTGIARATWIGPTTRME